MARSFTVCCLPLALLWQLNHGGCCAWNQTCSVRPRQFCKLPAFAAEGNLLVLHNRHSPSRQYSLVYTVPLDFLFFNINQQMHSNCHRFTTIYSQNTLHSYMFHTLLVHHQGTHQSFNKTIT